MRPRLFTLATTTVSAVLLLSACGGSASENPNASESSTLSSATASAIASNTISATSSEAKPTTEETSAPAETTAAPEETSAPAETAEAPQETSAPEETNADSNDAIAAAGTDCGKIDRPNSLVSTFILGGKTSCATATAVMTQFYDSMDNAPSQTINGFTCQKKHLYRDTGTYAVCTEPTSAAYVEMRYHAPLFTGPVADTEAFYSPETNLISFYPASDRHAVACVVESGGAIECDGISYESMPDQGAAMWNVKMNAGEQPVVKETRTQGGVYRTSLYTHPLDIGTVINFSGGSCKALSADSIECAVYGGGHFTISDQGVQQ